MYKMRYSPYLLVVFAVWPALLSGEYILGRLTATQQKLLDDTRSLKVQLTMDRTEYLPGEVAFVKVRVTNETDQALQVMKPFEAASGGLDMLYRSSKAAPGLFGPYFRNSHREQQIAWGGPTVWMAARESQETIVSTMDRSLVWEDFARGERSVPREPGEYAAEYTMVPGSMVKFRVVPVVIEQIASGRLPDIIHGNRPENRVVVQGYTRVAVLRAGDVRFLVVTHGERGDSRVSPADTREASAQRIREISPFARIAQLGSPPQSLEISSPTNAEVTVRCMETNGRRHLYVLDEQRVVTRSEQ